MIFAIEPLAECWEELVALARSHWFETEEYRHDQQFNPDFERYNKYDAAGWHFQVTARDNGRMVGYAGIYIMPSMHTQEMVATEDAWFLLPEYRGKMNGYNLYKFIEEECRKRGAVEITMQAKMTNNVGNLLERLGYTMSSQQYTKKLVRADSASTKDITDVRRIASARA